MARPRVAEELPTPAVTPAAGALVAPTVVQAEHDAARAFAAAEKAESTRRAYQADLRAFATWCEARDLAWMPASPETVAAFLAASASAGLKVSSISRRAAAIGYAHRLAAHSSPIKSERVGTTLRGIRRTLGAAKAKKAPATADRVEAMLATVPDTLAGLRDRALLLLGFAGALRRSELVALQVEDIEATPAGIRVLIRRSKTDQEGQGQAIGIPAGGKLGVVPALTAWLEAADLTSGPIFRAISKHGQLAAKGLSDRSAADIVKAYAGRAGLDPAGTAGFSGHSLRRGFLTSAAKAGASLAKMKEVSRHRSADVLLGYVHDAELFQDHAGSSFL